MSKLFDEVVYDVARLVRDAGGRALVVGGAVRDSILGRAVKDIDIEVFNLAPDKLQQVLGSKYRLDLVGISFGVLKLHHHDVDISLPRRESKHGLGHKGFEINSDPSLSVYEASLRRDFTINAIYYDPLEDEFEDPVGGMKDLDAKTLRHVSDKFAEDPLRVLRAMQFVARFDLTPHPSTLEVCKNMTPEGLPPERLFEEWAKLITKGVKISRGLQFLRDTGWVQYYPELVPLIGCKQEPAWHPEGDVWNHTCCSLDAFGKRRTNDPQEDLIVGLAVLCHDFGKPATTVFERGRIRSPGHDEAGVEPTLSFLRRLTNEERILREVPPLVQYHMSPYAFYKMKAGDSAIRRLALKVVRIDRLIRVCEADDDGRPPYVPDFTPLEWLAAETKRLEIADAAPKPIVQGRDLIALGYKPCADFGVWLKACFEAQLDGSFSDVEGGREFLKRYMQNLD